MAASQPSKLQQRVREKTGYIKIWKMSKITE
jgi:hypothetical protein